MPSAICFIEKSDGIRVLDKSTWLCESGDWIVSEAKAADLVGKRIYFLESQAGESHYGGVIQGYRVLPDDHPTAARRVVFTFTADNALRGFRPGPDGWGMEQKSID